MDFFRKSEISKSYRICQVYTRVAGKLLRNCKISCQDWQISKLVTLDRVGLHFVGNSFKISSILAKNQAPINK